MGYYTLVDAAALVPTASFSLVDHPVDALAISFYKMFGFPTGVGALIVKKSFLAQLKRPWFAGGTVDLVQVPGTIVTRAHEPHERFEVRKPCSFFGLAKSVSRTVQSTILVCPPLRKGFVFFPPIFPFYPCVSHAS
jgi:selenocysteine lyase/cysteine desulfurase